MYVRRAINAADPAYSCVQACTTPETAGRSISSNGLPCRGRPREHHRAGLPRMIGMLSRRSQPVHLLSTRDARLPCTSPGSRATGQRRHHPGPAPPDANPSDRSRPARERHHARDVQRASVAELRIERVPVERFRFEHGDLSVAARTLRPDMAVVAALAAHGRAVLVPSRPPLLADTTLPLLRLLISATAYRGRLLPLGTSAIRSG